MESNLQDGNFNSKDLFSIRRGVRLMVDGWFYLPLQSITILYTIIISLVLTKEEFYKDSIITIALSFVYFISDMFADSMLKYTKKTYVGAKLILVIVLIYGLITALILNSLSMFLMVVESQYALFRDIVANDLAKEGKRYHHLYIIRGLPVTILLYVLWFGYGYKFSLEEALIWYSIVDFLANALYIYVIHRRNILELYNYKATFKEEVAHLRRAFIMSSKSFYKLILNNIFEYVVVYTGDLTGLLKQYKVLVDFRDTTIVAARIPVDKYLKYISTRTKVLNFKMYVPHIISSSTLFIVSAGIYAVFNRFDLTLTTTMLVGAIWMEYIHVNVYTYDSKLMLNPNNNLKLFIATAIDIVPKAVIQIMIPSLYASIIMSFVSYFLAMLYLRIAYLKDESTVNRLIDMNVNAEL